MADDETPRFENDPYIVKKVTDILNEEFGDDVKNLTKARDVAAKLEKTRSTLLNKISGEGEGTPHKLAHIMTNSKSSLSKMKTLLSQRDSLSLEMQEDILRDESKVNEFLPITQKISELEKYRKYLQWIKQIEDISSDVRSAMEADLNQKAASNFVRLVEICNSLQDSACKNLVHFVTETTQFWHKILKDKFSREFDEILKQMKWPFIPSAPGIVHTPSYEVLSRFEQMFGLLLDIHMPDFSKPKSTPGSTTLLLPLQLLFRPFRKRFLYHFSGNKKTNSIHKPEWYFTQVLIWIRAHLAYIEQYVQPVLNRASRTQISAKVEFMQILVELVIAKLKTDIPEALYDDATMAHIINETLIFERELRSHHYPPGYPTCLDVLTQDTCFIKWLNIEKKLAQDNVDKILSSDTAWTLQYQDQGDIEDNKVLECAEKFLTMIQSITERYKSLPLPGHRLQFLELQLELIDDFRLRLFQLLENKEPMTFNFCSILNVVYYVTHILQDWCDLPFFLQMQCYRLQFMNMQKSVQLRRPSTEPHRSASPSQLEDGGLAEQVTSPTSTHKEVLDLISEGLDTETLDAMEGAVFEDSVELFERMKDEMISTLANYVVMEVKAKSRPYKNEKWFAMPSFKEFVQPSISPMAYGMLMVLSSSLQFLQKSLAMPLFNATWQIIADHLNDFVYEEVILNNHFNEGGASQLNFDMTRNFFPIFAEYTRHPENYFKKIKEACILLTLSKGSALLLKDALTANPEDLKSQQSADPTHVLEEIGVHKLAKDVALNLLNLRTDLTLV